MLRNPCRFAWIAALFVPALAHAATVNISVTDASGKAVRDAVVSLEPIADSAIPASRLPDKAIIDQRNETFIPLVSLLRKDGHVVFTNNDTTRHQVYSFSPIKQFAFEVDEGRRSEPVEFDKAGVAAIGCNIHDQMITYVFVADTPWAAVADADGHARISDVVPGQYRAIVWHPRLAPGRSPPATTLIVKADTNLSLSVDLLRAPPGKHMHMGGY